MAPLNCTGLKLATGVMIHVLPTWKSTDVICVAANCAGNLYATARRG
ncbi:MAG: hypothetical protein WCG98_07055 [bacterium]